MYLIFGLGNQGLRYKRTRHNLGFLVLDEVARRLQFKINCRGYYSLRKEVYIEGKPVVLIKPQTYMNNSGMAVKSLIEKYKAVVEDIFVISDDMNLNFGEIRIRRRGSDGGHRGLKSIIQAIGSSGFPRMKIGIKPLKTEKDTAHFVLREIRDEEMKKIKKIIDYAAMALENFIREGLEKTMQKYNKKALEF